MRDFGSGADASYEKRRQSREHPSSGISIQPRMPEPWINGGKAGNIRALMQGKWSRTPVPLIKRRQSRERPSPARMTAENARAVD